jgi:hypothetical protein
MHTGESESYLESLSIVSSESDTSSSGCCSDTN